MSVQCRAYSICSDSCVNCPDFEPDDFVPLQVVSEKPFLNTTNALVILVFPRGYPNGRFFSGFGKGQRLQSAWSIAGARLFMVGRGHSQSPEFFKIQALLTEKRIPFQIRSLSLDSEIIQGGDL